MFNGAIQPFHRLRCMSVRKCKRCGGVEFYKSGKCAACSREYASSYRASNRDQVMQATKRWRENNPEIIASYRARYKEENKDAILKYAAIRLQENRAKINTEKRERYRINAERERQRAAAWRIKNPEKRRIFEQNRRARKAKNGGVLSRDIAARLFALQKGRCPCCGMPLGIDYELDHKMPLALGGEHVDSNMQLLRKECNRSKKARHPVEYMQSHGFLL